MTRVAVETLAVSSSRSECIVSGSRFTVSTLMSSFLKVTSLRPGTGGGSLDQLLSAGLWAGELSYTPTPPHSGRRCLLCALGWEGRAAASWGPHSLPLRRR